MTKDPNDPESAPETSAGPLTSSGGAPPASVPVFNPGQILGGRFHIVRFLGQGGMGNVYEAEDQELQEHIALKMVRPEIAVDERAIERFRREIRIARRVTHPNVCRIFDVFHHAAPGESKVAFLTMELLRGETLYDRLRRAGRMTTAEALPIVQQMTAALAAAHEAGVIHRDFKSANVMLVPAAGSTVRAVVTDFGLASYLGTTEATGGATSTMAIIGTPEYMAPEQVEGGTVSAAADIYALGVVLYEMVTGAFPFSGSTPLAGLVKRLREVPPSPRTLVQNLDPTWESVILKCLERAPSGRPASATAVVEALEGRAPTPTVPLAPPAVAAQPRARGRWIALGIGLLVVLAAVVLGRRVGEWRGAPQQAARAPEPAPVAAPPAPIPTRRAVAVLGFKNLSGRTECGWLSTALSEMLNTELGAGEKLRTIPGENVARMKLELKLSDADSLAGDTLSRIRANLGADYVVLGSYLALGAESGGQIRLDVRLQDTAAGETIATTAETGTEARLFDLVSRTGARFREKLGIGELSHQESARVKAVRPATPEAARFYSEGLQKLRLFDAVAGRDLLTKAVASDPENPLAHAALSSAWSALGDDDQARVEAKRSFDLAAKLSREQRLAVEARLRETTGDWNKAVESFATLYRSFPDNPEYGLRLAEARIASGSAAEGLATIEGLRKHPSLAADDPRPDLVEAQAAAALLDFKREQTAAGKAAKKAIAQGARLQVARARLLEGSAAVGLKQWTRALGAYEEARGIYEAAGDQKGVAAALNSTAQVRSQLGELGEARKLHEAALDRNKKAGDQAGVAKTLDSIAGVASSQGDVEGAVKLAEQAIQQTGRLGGMPPRAMANIANLYKRSGKLGKSEEMYGRALAALRKTGNKPVLAAMLDDLGAVMRLQGNLDGARGCLDEALGLWHELGDKGSTVETRLKLAALLLDEGRATDAEARAAEVVTEAHAEGRGVAEAYAHLLLTQAYLEQKRLAAARESLQRAMTGDWKRGNHELRLSAAIVSARVRAASGRSGEAVTSLEATVGDARKNRLLEVELEARLALGQIELRTGAAGGRARLEELEKTAKEKGFGLVARKAQSAMTRS
jgi:tetratricopeptide (TPR) repeat protein/tRNA A-37 threonylcarbamoyl transferase component Bud32/TolB-like protein